MSLSRDAIVFGLGYLRGSKSKLSFGGEGAQMEITPRARAALNELLSAGYATHCKADDRIPGREHYAGVSADPHLCEMAKAIGINPFGDGDTWTAFRLIGDRG